MRPGTWPVSPPAREDNRVLAILSTEFGVNVDGATVNVRDAAPLCAGLIFGAPAGKLMAAGKQWMKP